MDDPDAVVGETVGAGQKKNPRDETPVGTERGGEKKPVLEKPPTAPRAATSSTFDGLSVRGDFVSCWRGGSEAAWPTTGGH
jgi:hypothetical protein